MAPPCVVVAGALANKPFNGGEAWVRLSWIRGFQRLGCRVWFVEQLAQAHCTDDLGAWAAFAGSCNRRWFADVSRQFGLEDSATLICDNGEVDGVAVEELREIAADGALLVNIGGHLDHAALVAAFGRRVFVDIDPGFTQFWAANGTTKARLCGHHRYFTIGENIGRPDCAIPTIGRRWLPVRQPVVLDDWPVADGPGQPFGRPRFTTIATWRGPFGPIEHDRRRFGLKLHEFRKYIGLPALVDAQFEAALAIHPDEHADLALLSAHDWNLADPRGATGTTDRFRSYVAASMAEFSVAQGMYIESNSGWFSDRSTRYLACGRPVLVQDSGFRRHLPSDMGLVAFASVEEARVGAQSILTDYDEHRGAARTIAETYFDSSVVLSRFLSQCGMP